MLLKYLSILSLAILVCTSSSSYANGLPLIGQIDCNLALTRDLAVIDIKDDDAYFCARNPRTEDKILTLAIFENSCQRVRLLQAEDLRLTTIALDECMTTLKLGSETVVVTTDYGDDMERLMKAERIKAYLLGGGIGIAIGIILSAVLMVAL